MSFSRQALASLAITGGYAILAMGIGVLTARLLGVEGFGLYASVIAHVNMLAILVTGGLPTLLLREITAADHAGDEGLLRGLIRRAQQFTGLASAIIALGALALWLLLDAGSGWWVTFWPALAVMACLSFLDVKGAGLRALGQPLMGQVPASLLRPALHLGLLATLAIWVAPIDPVMAVLAFLAASLLALAVSSAMLGQRLSARSSTPPVFRDRDWLRALGIFLLAGGFIRLNQHLGGVMLEHLSDRRQIALFQAAMQMTMLVLLIRQSIAVLLMPRIKRAFLEGTQADQQRLLVESARISTLFAVLLGGGLMALGQSGIGWIFGEDFADSYDVLAVMIAGQIVIMTLGHPGIALTQAGFERDSARTMALAVALNLAIGIVLIPVLGALGAGFAAIAGLFIATALQARLCQRRLGIRGEAFAPSTPK
ncbi:MAG: oligosaccharide flippase family protein [Pseudomonadota bacterium]